MWTALSQVAQQAGLGVLRVSSMGEHHKRSVEVTRCVFESRIAGLDGFGSVAIQGLEARDLDFAGDPVDVVGVDAERGEREAESTERFVEQAQVFCAGGFRLVVEHQLGRFSVCRFQARY
jgi:hypothetical protein